MGLMPTLPMSRPLTAEDLEAIRDVEDGHRYELIDGVLLVTPSPVPRHQRAVGQLFLAVTRDVPPGYEVFTAPLDIRMGPDTVVQPDVLVAATASVTERRIEGPPVLAVEVLSPSTRDFDLGTKLLRYQRAGTAAYWVIDPHEPSLRAWELRAGTYTEVAHVTGDQPAELTVPWPVRIVPQELVAPPAC